MKKDWNGSNEGLQKEVTEFREKMLSWRMMNLSEVYEGHQNWSDALKRLTSMFNASYNFYDAFINELRNSRFQQAAVRPLEINYPLNGVTPLDLEPGKGDIILISPLRWGKYAARYCC